MILGPYHRRWKTSLPLPERQGKRYSTRTSLEALLVSLGL